MITPDLLKYIETEISKGTTKETIQSNLLSGGWNLKDITEGFSTVAIKNNNSVPQDPINPNINIQNTPQFSVPVQNYQAVQSSLLKKNVVTIIVLILAVLFGYLFINSLQIKSPTQKSITTLTVPIGEMKTYSGTGDGPGGIAFDGTNMWTANSGSDGADGNSVTKISPTGIMTTYKGIGNGYGGGPIGIAFDGTNMWTTNTNSNSVTKITPTGIITTYTMTTYGTDPHGIAFDGTNMWTANGGNNSLTKIAPDGSMITYDGLGYSPTGIAFDGTNMWTTYVDDIGKVTKISPTGIMTTYTGTGAYPVSIVFDGTNMWTANQSGKSVTKISPTGITTTYTGTGAYPKAIAFDGTNMWTANGGAVDSKSVTKISPTGTMTTYSGTGVSPEGIAFDGTNMWTANGGDNSVTKIVASSSIKNK